MKTFTSITYICIFFLSIAVFGGTSDLDSEPVSSKIDGRIVYEMTGLDSVPRKKKQVPPVYPKSLWNEGVTGSVLVEFIVLKNGSVTGVKIHVSNHAEFSESVREAVTKWEFEPATYKGKKVNSRVRVVIPFDKASAREEVEGRIYGLEEVSQAPEPILQRSPIYPNSLKRKLISGSVDVAFVITESGRTAKIRVMRSDHELFSRAVIEAVREWEFRPAELDGEPVNCQLSIKVPFSIH